MRFSENREDYTRAQKELGVWANETVLTKLKEDPVSRHMAPTKHSVRTWVGDIPLKLLKASPDLGIQGLGAPEAPGN